MWGYKLSREATGDAAMLKTHFEEQTQKKKNKINSVLFLHWGKNVTRQRWFRITQTPMCIINTIHACLKFKSGHQMASRCVYGEICPARCCFPANSG